MVWLLFFSGRVCLAARMSRRWADCARSGSQASRGITPSSWESGWTWLRPTRLTRREALRDPLGPQQGQRAGPLCPDHRQRRAERVRHRLHVLRAPIDTDGIAPEILVTVRISQPLSGIVRLDSVASVRKERIDKLAGRCNAGVMEAVGIALRAALDL